MPLRFIYILVFFSTGYSSLAQEYNYQHYDLSNGLSGLTVYSAVQDKNGYMWFGTETGLSRFDGSKFKNFTTSDGLPDNEVLKLYVDSKIGDFTSFLSTETGFGTVTLKETKVSVNVVYGKIIIEKMEVG